MEKPLNDLINHEEIKEQLAMNVSGIETSKDKQAIVSAMVGMARNLGMTVVEEGVKKVSERDFLVEIECDLIQGYLYSKPLPREEFEPYFLKHRKSHLPI